MSNTNSPIAATVTLVAGVVAFAGFGWHIGVAYVVGFLVGGVGTAVNVARMRRGA